MNSVFFILLIFLSTASANATDAAVKVEKRKVTLEDAKKYAINNNFLITALKKEVQAKEAKRRAQSSKFYPILGVAGGLENENTSGELESRPLGYVYGRYNLFNGYRDRLRTEMSDVDLDITQIRLRQKEHELGLSIEEAFHIYIYQRDLIAIKTEEIKYNTKHTGLVKKTQRAGISSKSDRMEFDLEHAILSSDLVMLQRMLEEARIKIVSLLGEEIGATIEPVGSLQHQHVKGTLMAQIDKLKKNGYAVQLASREMTKSTVGSKLWRANYLPTFDIEARAGRLEGDAMPKDEELGIDIMLVAKLDLFSGLNSYWERRERILNLESSQNKLKQTIVDSVSEVERSYRKLVAIQNRVDLEDANRIKSKKYYDAVLREYRSGYKNAADLKAASELVFASHAKMKRFKFEFLQERINLERTTGHQVEVEVVKDHAK